MPPAQTHTAHLRWAARSPQARPSMPPPGPGINGQPVRDNGITHALPCPRLLRLRCMATTTAAPHEPTTCRTSDHIMWSHILTLHASNSHPSSILTGLCQPRRTTPVYPLCPIHHLLLAFEAVSRSPLYPPRLYNVSGTAQLPCSSINRLACCVLHVAADSVCIF